MTAGSGTVADQNNHTAANISAGSTGSPTTGVMQPGAGTIPGAGANTGTTQTSFNTNVASDTRVYLPLVPVKINSDPRTFYALLDCASTCSFINADVADDLNLQRVNSNYKVNTISSQTRVSEIVSFDLSDTSGFGSVHLGNVLVIPDIPTRNPRESIDVNLYPHLQNIPLMQRNDVKVSLLLGMDNAHLIVPYETKRDPEGRNQPYATLTYFGWALGGPVSGSFSVAGVGKVTATREYSNNVQGHLESVNVAGNFETEGIETESETQYVETKYETQDVETKDKTQDIETKIENLWRIESGPTDGHDWSNDDRRVVDFWDKETEVIDNRYVVPIPWKQGHRPVMPNNLPYAQHRLSSLKKRLDKTGLTQKYDESISKLLNKGYAEKVPSDDIKRTDGSAWYVPHHHVIKKTKDAKLRVVMDCSAKFRGTSFNDECYTGPNLMNNILDVLLRFRQYKYAVTCDIEGYYMRVKLKDSDKDYLRFLWYDQDGLLTHYRMNSHLFGAVCSSAVAGYALRRIIKDETVSDRIKSVITKSFYVDDLLRAEKTKTDLREVVYGTKTVLGKKDFNLTEIIINDPDLCDEFKSTLPADQVKDIFSDTMSKALGIRWNVVEDFLFYVCRPLNPDAPVTRTSILSQVSSMYDPPGLIMPIILKGRMIFQDLTKLKFNWTDTAPDATQ